jgi:NADPH-dependent curcumin reductase CurA
MQAGTDEKCKWLKTIGADVTINYKSKTFVEGASYALLVACIQGGQN